MIKLILTIVLCCVVLCSGLTQLCIGTPFTNFENKTRIGSEIVGRNMFQGKRARAVYSRSDGQLFTLMDMRVELSNARHVKLHGVTKQDKETVTLRNTNSVDLPVELTNYPMQKLVLNAAAADKTKPVSLTVVLLDGCLSFTQSGANDVAEAEGSGN